MAQQRNSRRANGHPGPNGRPNGHGPASAERGGALAPACIDRHHGRAASDDASGNSVARAAALPAAASLHLQASTVREAYAEAAPPAPHEAAQEMSPKTNASADQDAPEKEVPPGKSPLPDNISEFVDEIHKRIDLFEVWHGLLRNKDDKVRQHALERLTDLRYKGAAASPEEPQQFIFDLPRPKRD